MTLTEYEQRITACRAEAIAAEQRGDMETYDAMTAECDDLLDRRWTACEHPMEPPC